MTKVILKWMSIGETAYIPEKLVLKFIFLANERSKIKYGKQGLIWPTTYSVIFICVYHKLKIRMSY